MIINILLQAKEWLCLNCQVHRAPGPPMVSPQPQPSKAPTSSQPQTKMPSSPQKKEAKPTDKTEPTQQSPQQKPPQQQDPGKPQQMPKGVTSPAKTAPQPEAKTPKQETSLFGFGLGGITDTVRSRSPSPQPVSGKVMGFGSSLFSSASNLITSAVQDEPSPTPPTARKESMSAKVPAKAPPAAETKPPATQKPVEKKPEDPLKATVPPAAESKPPAAQKPGEKQDDKKPEVAAQAKAPSAPVKKEELPSKPQESQTGLQMAKSSCPLCKVDLNIGSKEPSNYNTCTECKTVVCNLCGFNPIPHLTEVSVKSSIVILHLNSNYIF